MGARGPRPTPTAILSTRGSRKAKERTGDAKHWTHSAKGQAARSTMAAALIGGPGAEPMPRGIAAMAPHKPPTISERAAAHWDAIVATCGAVPGLLTEMDRTLLYLHCEAYAAWIAAKEAVEKSGMTQVVSEGGTEGLRPEVMAMHAAWDRVLKSAKEMGLTPAARSAIRVDGQGRGAEFEVETVRTRRRVRVEK